MDPFKELKESFLEECDELLGALEGRLIALEEGSTSPDDVNAAFRAIHSIKGGAGAFGFPRLVEIAHVFEAALDHLRTGRMTLADAPLPLFLRAADAVASLVGAAKEDRELSAPAGIVRELQDVAVPKGPAAPPPAAPSADPEPEPEAAPEAAWPEPEQGEARDAPACVCLTLHPALDLFRRVVEPRILIGGLDAFGRVSVETLTHRLPAFAELDPNDCHLEFNISIETSAPAAAIAAALELQLHPDEFTIHEAAPKAVVGAGPAQASPDPDAWGASAAPQAPDSVAAPANDGQSDGGWDEPLPAAGLSPAPAQPVPALGTLATEPAIAKPALAEPVSARPVTVQPAVTEPAAAPSRAKVRQVGSIRVDLDRIDKLMNLVGEIVITQSMLDQRLLALSVAETVQIADGLQILSRQTRELQEYVMAVRAQPVRNVFQRMPRMVRELSQSLGKEARLIVRGEDTEVDKTIIEELSDPLIHMIRNSMDHGIETTAERLTAGKVAEGTITLQAEQRGGRIVITVSDDGRGINREKLLAKARQRGLLAADARPAPDEIDALIFHPGLSTADAVTDVSGRGVGMDVVKQNVEALGGRIMVMSEPGRGSRFTLLLPLTLAVMDGMIIRAGGQRLVLPIASIIETLQLGEATVERLPGGQEFLRLRESLLPLVRLGPALGMHGTGEDQIVVMTETDRGERIGLAVEEIISQQQVVVKSLEASYGRVPGASAATILGDGLVALIVDVDAIPLLLAHPKRPIQAAA